MNEKQLKQFLNNRLVIKLKNLEEVKQFFDYCIQLNQEYDEEIHDTVFRTSGRTSGSYYALYNYCTCHVEICKFNSNDFKESIKIIEFNDIKPYTPNTVNKLISWIN